LPELGRGHSASGNEGKQSSVALLGFVSTEKLCRSQKRKACSVSVMIPFNIRKKIATSIFFNYKGMYEIYALTSTGTTKG